MNNSSLDNAYQLILQERLLLIEKYSQYSRSPESAESFREEWAKVDVKERNLVESVKCTEDLTMTKSKKDKATGERTKTVVHVIGKGDTWSYSNMDGIQESASCLILMNYHPPQDNGKSDWSNGCVTANTRLLPTSIQRLNGGTLTDNGRLTDETKDSIDEHLTISDFYTFIPKYKDWYTHEAKLFAKSAGIELFDFQLSGILQVAGQAMSTYLKGEQF